MIHSLFAIGTAKGIARQHCTALLCAELFRIQGGFQSPIF